MYQPASSKESSSSYSTHNASIGGKTFTFRCFNDSPYPEEYNGEANLIIGVKKRRNSKYYKHKPFSRSVGACHNFVEEYYILGNVLVI